MAEYDLKVAVIGGGTGLSTILRGLKRYPIDLTAIVTVADQYYWRFCICYSKVERSIKSSRMRITSM